VVERLEELGHRFELANEVATAWFWPLHDKSVNDRGCVKTQENEDAANLFPPEIEFLLDEPVIRARNGIAPVCVSHFRDARDCFYTASTLSGRSTDCGSAASVGATPL
jgi:hypothetical protein